MTQNTTELLDAVKHKDLKIDTLHVDTPHNHINAANVSVTELAMLIQEYPIFITKNPNSGQFMFSAILGIKAGENLFIQDNKWNAKFLPIDILRRPFMAMLQKDGDLSGGRIALDTANPVVQTEKGERLFNEDGKPSPYLERIQQIFSQLMGSAEVTANILNTMYQHNLLESISLNLNLGEGKSESMNGLYSINKETLASLTGEALEQCHKQGVLEVCHLVLNSAVHLDKLIQWKIAKTA